MFSDLDQQLAATLKQRAGGDVDPAPIVAHARDHGRRLRRRRRGLIAGGMAAACAALTVAVLAVPPGRTPDDAVVPAAAFRLPEASGQPGAIARPEDVGADPGVVHFSADALVSGADSATWRAGRGIESVEFRGPTGQARFALARSEASLDGLQQTLSSAGRPQPPTAVLVGGRPGAAWFDPSGDQKLWFVRWQPADGLWAQLDSYAATRDDAIGVAGRVRFDDAQRCVVPFRLESLPPGGRLLECSVTLGDSERRPFIDGSLVVGDGSGRWLTVRAQLVTNGYEARSGDLVAGDYRARRQGSDVLEMVVEPCVVEAFLKGWGNGYAESDGLVVLGGYRPARDFGRPDTW
ncbi:hypothetical protein [Micromonospora parathelypteridis]|uniref:Uncharacterized protein n=1 Tax=Micromonospora parathelypteridis TaxID=1839617 RepID=A0A840VYF8_9ACTN|nr:hypothetical protein [Micromonospora parathelypteridis]MBB5477129.1 hypothetical protein [Micromonospora parathelypteridis]GGO08326.1 hypothetical protein GCM10011576_13630 [Micromonospora parathelypteridis]